MSYPMASIQAAVSSRTARQGAGWNPAAVSPFMWYEADYGLYQDAAKTTPATADAQRVGAVVDRGSNNLDWTQTDDAKRPTLKLNILNGKPVIRVATLQGMATLAFGAAIAQPNTIFFVAKFGSISGITFDGLAAPNRHWFTADAPATGYYIYAGSTLNRGTPDTNYHVFSVCYNGANSYLRVDGVQAGAVGNPGAQGIGGYKFFGTGSGGDILAVIGVHAISDANRDLMEVWLTSKYGPF